MTKLETLITTCCALGSAQTLETLGLSAGEISQSRAREVYKKWFTDAAKQGRIRPCRVEDGGRGTRYFRVVDILKLKAQDAAKIDLI